MELFAAGVSRVAATRANSSSRANIEENRAGWVAIFFPVFFDVKRFQMSGNVLLAAKHCVQGSQQLRMDVFSK